MLIGFLGAPSSGKTTTALGLAYNLKLDGLPVEYMPEPARYVIREFGYNNQDEILRRELNNVELAKNYPESIWVTDGGAYMGQFYGGSSKEFSSRYDIIVHCPVIYTSFGDSGRIHDNAFSVKTAKSMADWACEIENIVEFNGDLQKLSNLIKGGYHETKAII